MAGGRSLAHPPSSFGVTTCSAPLVRSDRVPVEGGKRRLRPVVLDRGGAHLARSGQGDRGFVSAEQAQGERGRERIAGADRVAHLGGAAGGARDDRAVTQEPRPISTERDRDQRGILQRRQQFVLMLVDDEQVCAPRGPTR